MAFAFILPLRIVQGVLALIILVLMAYVVDQWSPAGGWSPSEANFLLFCAAWTLIASVYLIVAPMHFPDAAHKFAILAVEAVTAIFWFAGWVAFATLLGSFGGRHWTVKQVGEAADVFAAFEWLLFSATTVMASLHCWRTRNDRSGKHDPAMEVQRDPAV